MSLDPDAETLLAMIRAAGRAPMETLSPDEARQQFRAGRAVTQPDPQEVAEVRDLSCPGPHGAIPLRAYRPMGTAANEVLPVLVYYHGGGWLLGDLDSHDVACRHYANVAKCRVVSVDYRMAPEYKFPAAVDDCAAATDWVVAQADALGIDRKRVAVGGDSAGGNLAAVIALMARDGDLPAVAFQLLVYPVTDLGMTHELYQARHRGRAADVTDDGLVHRSLLAGTERPGGLACFAAARGRSVRCRAGAGADCELRPVVR